MATAAQQAKWRSRDAKRTVEVRLDPAALARLDKLAVRSGAVGRGEVIERLVLADAQAGPHRWLLDEAVRLGREYLTRAGAADAALRDESRGWVYVIRRERL